MNIEKQVCSLKLAKRLKELGVKQESCFMWEGIMADVDKMRFKVKKFRANGNPWAYSAFTVAELGEMLPQIIEQRKIRYQLFVSVALDKQWFVVYANEEDYSDNLPIPFMMCRSEADARAKMFIYLIENKLITV